MPPRALFQGTHRGHRRIWYHRAVIRILENPVYMGRRVWHHNGNEIVKEVPAIVDESTFRLAEQLRAKNRREAMRNSRRRCLLRGLIRWGLCGLSYVGQSANGQNEPHFRAYYQCMGSKKVNRTLPTRCETKAVSADLLEALVEGLTIDTVYDERGRKTAKVTVCCRLGGQRGGVSDSDSDALGPGKPKSLPSRTEKLIWSTATTSP